MSETPQTKAEAVPPHVALIGMGDMLVARLVQERTEAEYAALSRQGRLSSDRRDADPIRR
jgi:hypothetical protein